jgi:hypothetical protein
LREIRRQEAAAAAASGAPPAVGVPTALEITARRDAPGQEKAELRFQGSGAESAAIPAPAATPEPLPAPSLAPAPSRNPFADSTDTPVQR